MSTQWGEIYSDVVSVLLEPTGLQLGLLTDDQFYTFCGEVLIDFLAATGLAKKIANYPFLFTVPTYPVPDVINQVEAASGDETYLFESSDFYLSNRNPYFETTSGTPESFKQDDLLPLLMQVYPAPDYTGSQVEVAAGQGGYGVIAAVDSASDFTVTAPYGGYGTISSTSGSIYVNSLNPGYGVVAYMCASANNLSIQGTAIPYDVSGIGPETYIESVPDSFTPYLKYGVLARIFSSDSELKSETKAQYAQARYTEGVALVAGILGESQG